MNGPRVTQYDPKNPAHEMLALQWFLVLRGNPDELNALFDSSLRTLTSILGWMARDVVFTFELDDEGIWVAAWYQKYMGSLWLGGWVRKSKRGTKAMLKATNEVMEKALILSPTVLAITTQRTLQRFLMHCGFRRYADQPIPHLFDDQSVWLYIMTRETRDGKIKPAKRSDLQPVQPRIVEAVQSGSPNDSSTGGTDDLGVANGRGERQHPVNQRKRIKRKRIVQPQSGRLETAIGKNGGGR